MTEEERRYVKRHYSTMSVTRMASNLGLGSRKIKFFMQQNELVRKPFRGGGKAIPKSIIPEGCFDYNDKRNFEV